MLMTPFSKFFVPPTEKQSTPSSLTHPYAASVFDEDYDLDSEFYPGWDETAPDNYQSDNVVHAGVDDLLWTPGCGLILEDETVLGDAEKDGTDYLLDELQEPCTASNFRFTLKDLCSYMSTGLEDCELFPLGSEPSIPPSAVYLAIVGLVPDKTYGYNGETDIIKFSVSRPYTKFRVELSAVLCSLLKLENDIEYAYEILDELIDESCYWAYSDYLIEFRS